MTIRLEAIAIGLEAIAIRLEAIAIRLEAITIRFEAMAIRLEAVGGHRYWVGGHHKRLEGMAIRLEAIGFHAIRQPFFLVPREYRAIHTRSTVNCFVHASGGFSLRCCGTQVALLQRVARYSMPWSRLIV